MTSVYTSMFDELKKLAARDLEHRIQQKDYSCGAAAVRAALASVGVDVPERTLRKELGTTSKEGTSIPNIISFFEGLKGVSVHGSTSTVQALRAALEKGSFVIVPWQSGTTPTGRGEDWSKAWEDGHYSLVRSIQKDSITLADPTKKAPLTYPLAEFEKRWHDRDRSTKYNHYAVVVSIDDPKALAKSAAADVRLLSTPEERQQAASLEHRVFAPNSKYQDPKPPSAAKFTSYGIFDDGKLVATTRVNLNPTEPWKKDSLYPVLKKLDPEVAISATAVDPAHRGKGYATALRAHVSSTYDGVLTTTGWKSDPAMGHINESQGFKKLLQRGKRTVWHKE